MNGPNEVSHMIGGRFHVRQVLKPEREELAQIWIVSAGKSALFRNFCVMRYLKNHVRSGMTA
jgi:hypothetical protein